MFLHYDVTVHLLFNPQPSQRFNPKAEAGASTVFLPPDPLPLESHKNTNVLNSFKFLQKYYLLNEVYPDYLNCHLLLAPTFSSPPLTCSTFSFCNT